MKDAKGVLQKVGTENWGGSMLDDHHSFIVIYRPDQDKHLDMHIDESDVTFNFGITPSDNFSGNDLTFCGMFNSETHRKEHFAYKHQSMTLTNILTFVIVVFFIRFKKSRF